MKKKITTYLLGFAFLLGIVAFVPATSFADTTKGLCQGANLSFSAKDADGKDNTNCNKGGKVDETQLNGLVAKVINIITVIVGIVAVVMIIVGGFKYITSGGDSNKVGSAKNTILYAIIGLIVVALAQFIVKFVLNKTKAAAGS